MDPFAPADGSPDPQAARPSPSSTSAPKTKSGKPKMAIFSDAGASADSQPAASGRTKGWDNIGSMEERKKENRVEAKPWAGETLKAGKKAAPTQKMAIFRDEVSCNCQVAYPISDLHIFTIAGLITGLNPCASVICSQIQINIKKPKNPKKRVLPSTFQNIM
jgi:checkpoint serine/threonine-protein kinase